MNVGKVEFGNSMTNCNSVGCTSYDVSKINIYGESKIVDDSQPVESAESFQAVFDEMSQNVPSQTRTVEEKEKAISYINRMLACKDIPDHLKTYWQDKKETIQAEIFAIKSGR